MTSVPSALPPIYFNHLYLVLDDKTYHAVQGSDFLRMAFPGYEQRTTLTGAGETWTGTYFYCQDNYLEFFGSGSSPVTGAATQGGHWQPGAQEGWAGLAFSVEQPGGADMVRQKLRERFQYEPFNELRQVYTKNRLINWFYSVNLAERLGMGSFDSWLMEYHPDIFVHKGLPIPSDGNLTRHAYLSPWNKPRSNPKPVENPGEAAPDSLFTSSVHDSTPHPASSKPGETTGRGANAHQPEARSAPVFSHVTGATIHIDSKRADRFVEVLEMLGFTLRQTGEALYLSTQDFTLAIQPEETAPRGYRLSSLRLAMARPSVAPMTFIFAPRSKLVLKDDLTAEWFFGI